MCMVPGTASACCGSLVCSEAAILTLLVMRLTEMRNRMAGNFRWLLSDKPKEMRAPLEISNSLYFEGNFDTEALLRNLTKKVLEPAGYDYSGIAVILRNPPNNNRSTE